MADIKKAKPVLVWHFLIDFCLLWASAHANREEPWRDSKSSLMRSLAECFYAFGKT